MDSICVPSRRVVSYINARFGPRTTLALDEWEGLLLLSFSDNCTTKSCLIHSSAAAERLFSSDEEVSCCCCGLVYRAVKVDVDGEPEIDGLIDN